MLGPTFPVVHNLKKSSLGYVEGEVVVLAPHGQVSDHLPIGCLVVVADQAYHCCVICKRNFFIYPLFYQMRTHSHLQQRPGEWLQRRGMNDPIVNWGLLGDRDGLRARLGI